MKNEISMKDESLDQTFRMYEKKFKALADERRLHILNEITNAGEVCVCDLSEKLHVPQSKLSYHLRILMDADLISKDTRGTWSYYTLNHKEMNHLLSEELCCMFRRE